MTVTVKGPNGAPTVTLTSPANGSTFTAPATINLAANAGDPENQLARVEFYSGATLLGTDTAAPYVVHLEHRRGRDLHADREGL